MNIQKDDDAHRKSVAGADAAVVMLSGLKYFLMGCVFDAALLIVYMFWINSLQLNRCGRLFAFAYEPGCTLAGFLWYVLYFGGIVLLSAWWVTIPVFAFAPAVGLMKDCGMLDESRGSTR
ncbi:MAG TPA: hypothetical protein VFX96_01330 [Pyrinomonadaceae bacterium]|nr:hypothetical protein [Pyrinomonadaceae bacterium]